MKKNHTWRIIVVFFVIFACSLCFGQQEFNIRTVTAGIRISRADYLEQLEKARLFLNRGRLLLEKRGFTLQGVRLATNPFPQYTANLNQEQTLLFLKKISDYTSRYGITLSIGPGITSDRFQPEMVETICRVLTTTSASSSVVIASREGGIYYKAIKAAARIIKKSSGLKTMANFNFAAIANVPPETPFFPAAYHNREESTFSIGAESAKLFMDITETVREYDRARIRLAEDLNREFRKIEDTGRQLENASGWTYAGVDVSPAPMRDISIGRAIENLSGTPFGSPGTMAACAFITSLLKGIDVKQAGYSGLMLPVMEDVVLAGRAAEGRFGLADLLSYSAVCGTGLDVIPLPGDISLAALEGILLDVAAMSLKLNKPLSARLIPIKGKRAGEKVVLDSKFLLPTLIFPPDRVNIQ